jgi:hypothetical protein
VAIAERLIEQETIDNSELRALIEASSPSPMIVPGTADAAPPRRADEPVARKDTRDGPAAAGL